MARSVLRDDAGEIGDRRLRIQPREDVIAARIAGELIDPRAPVIEIAEYDRFRGAALLTRRHDVAVTDVAVFEPRLILGAAVALHAEGALCHQDFLPTRRARV